MANIKISDLPAAVAAQLAMEFEVNDNGTSRRVTGAQIDTLVLGATNGFVARTGTNARAARTLTAGTGIAVSNGNGASGNPTVALSEAAAAAITRVGATSGALVGTTDAQILTHKTLTGLRETRVALGAGTTLNLAEGNCFTKTVTGSTSFTLSNVPNAGTTLSFLLDITNGGAFAVTWPTGTRWAAGAAPELTPSGRDLLGFMTHDGGVTWNGVMIAGDLQ